MHVDAIRNAQDLNPLPFASAILNCSGWVVWCCLTRNWYIFASDCPGLLCAIWMTFSLYPHASLKVQNQLNAFMILAAGLWCVLTLTTMLLQELGSPASIANVWGWAVSITQVLLMASPLSGLIEALKTRSSANFHLGICIMNLVSSSMWTVYSVTIRNFVVGIPSVLGAVLSTIALLVCFVFPRQAPRSPAEQQQARERAAENALELG